MARGLMFIEQSAFQARIERQAKRLLERAGFDGSPQAVLVGLPTAGGEAVIEPEAALSTVQVRLLPDMQAVPHPQQLASGPSDAVGPTQSATSEDDAHARAQVEGIAKAFEADSSRAAFVSWPAIVDTYTVYIVLTVDNATLQATPRLANVDLGVPGKNVAGIVDALIVTLLERSRSDLFFSTPGRRDDDDTGGEDFNIPLHAVRRVVETALNIAEQPGAWETVLKVQSFASLQYEGRWSTGRLVIAPDNDPALELKITFKEPVPLSRYRNVRKLLESSGPDLAVLIDARSVYGLGKVREDTDLSHGKVFEIAVGVAGNWRLVHEGRDLLHVRDSLPYLPKDRLDLDELRAAIERTIDDADMGALEDLACTAARNRHGAMLIISSGAAAEAERLAPQAMRIEPTRLSPSTLDHLTNMDGGVLVDPRGFCHAIGVILDGNARNNGDPSRGSRYNNSIRYIGGDVPAAVVLCYSADGDIKILSTLSAEHGDS